MSKSVVLAIIAIGVASLVTLNVFLAGNKHVVAVKETVALHYEVYKLKQRNRMLQEDRLDLERRNIKLQNDMEFLQLQMESTCINPPVKIIERYKPTIAARPETVYLTASPEAAMKLDTYSVDTDSISIP